MTKKAHEPVTMEMFPEAVLRYRIGALVAASPHDVGWSIEQRQDGSWQAVWQLGLVGEELSAASELDALTELLARLRRELGAGG